MGESTDQSLVKRAIETICV